MMEVKYKCDICREDMRVEPGALRQFIGFEFANQRRPFQLRQGDPKDCVRHVCHSCLKALHDLWKDVEPRK